MVSERKSLTTTLRSLIPVNFAKSLRKPFLTEHLWASASRVWICYQVTAMLFYHCPWIFWSLNV